VRPGLLALLLLWAGPASAAADCQAPPQVPLASRNEQALPEPPSQWKLALDATIVTAVSVEALKRTIKDPRPYGEGHAHGYGYGFPSGDASLAFAFARLASHYHPRQRSLWYLLAARVAWSRVKREAHDWDDVIGGAALGCYIGDAEVAHEGLVLKKWEW
jgi:hypothetical protein